MDNNTEKSLEKIKKKKTFADFVQKFKKRWLINGISTLLLISIIFAVFIGINYGMKKWDPTPIDFTKSKDFTLTDESKERIKNIDKEVNISFVGYEESNADYKLAKQYNKTNSKIKVIIVDPSTNIEFAKKYDLTNESKSVVIECGENSRVLSSYDMISYDEQYNSVDIAEQKITSAIVNVTSDEKAKSYFLTGYTNFTLESNGLLASFAKYMKDEVLTFEELNILNTKKVPDDCDSLIIMTPTKDFDALVADEIIKYISKGGNILWLNGLYEEDKDFKNANRVLAQFGVNKFEKGIVYETDSKNIFLGYPTCFAPEITDNDILKNVKISSGAVFINATKINVDENKFEALKVTKTDLITSSDSAYFTKNLKSKPDSKQDEKGEFLLGAEFTKKISEANEKENKEEVNSTLILFSDDYIISDYAVTSGQYQIPVIDLANNKDIVFNSLAKLNNNDQEITIRKSYSDSETTFTPSERDLRIIMCIIFCIPLFIIVVGIIIRILRKHRR